MMSTTIGLCAFCGYGNVPKPAEKRQDTKPRAETTDTPMPSRPAGQLASITPAIVLRFETTRPTVTSILANAYHQAALAEADMPTAARLLEQIRTAFLIDREVFNVWDVLDTHIGAAAILLRSALLGLRDWFVKEFVGQLGQRFGELFEHDVHLASQEWLGAYAEALRRGRIGLCQALVSLPVPFPAPGATPIDFKRMTHLVAHMRWPEVYPLYHYLAQQEFLPQRTRARLLVTAAQIALYHLLRPEQAFGLLQEAYGLAPGDGRVLVGMGEYYLERNDLPQAQKYFEDGIKASPTESHAYVFMGDLADKKGDVEAVRAWYQEAVDKAGNDSLGYVRLLGLYGRPEFFERYEEVIVPLTEHAIAVDPEARYNILLSVGHAYLASKRYDKAHEWYQKAIALEPDQLHGYLSEGAAYQEQRDYERGRAAFEAAMRVAPESYNAYWLMGELYREQEQWEEAAKWYALSAPLQPEFQSALLARVGDMRQRLGQYEQAEAALFEALQIDPANDATLLNLAEAYYQKQRRSAEARRLYQRMREIKGDSFEASYQNRLGNVSYYEGDYERAAQYYSQAIQADNSQAVYYSNLGGAYKGMKRWAEARAHFKKAYEIDGDRTKYETEIAQGYNSEANDYYAQGKYEQAIEGYDQAIRLLPSTPRYPSNRALALEQLISTSKSGLELLNRAIADAHTAVELARSKEEYASQIEEYTILLARLEQQRPLIVKYGERMVAFDPQDKPIRIHVHAEVMPLVLTADMRALSQETLSMIDAMRNRIRERYGLTIPGLHFAWLEAGSALWGNYQIDIMSKSVAIGQLETDKKFAFCSEEQLDELQFNGSRPYQRPRMEDFAEGYWLDKSDWADAMAHQIALIDARHYLLRHIECVVTHYLHQLCGHQDVANMLAQCDTPDCVAIKSTPQKLHAVTGKLQALLRRREPIGDIARLCAEENQLTGAPVIPHDAEHRQQPTAELMPGITSLTLYLHSSSPLDRAQLAQRCLDAQSVLFDELGVLIPRVIINDSESIGQHDFQLQVNDEKLPTIQGLAPGELWAFVSFKTVQDRFPDGRPSIEPNSGQPAAIFVETAEVRRECETHGYDTRDPLGYVVFCVAAELRRRADQLLTPELVNYYLAKLKKEYPALVEVTRWFFSTEQLTQRLRRQLAVQSSIKNLPKTLEELLAE
jgi:tetratricopeptide (TPR) repeat protein